MLMRVRICIWSLMISSVLLNHHFGKNTLIVILGSLSILVFVFDCQVSGVMYLLRMRPMDVQVDAGNMTGRLGWQQGR
jgi:hypothetical protein